MTQDKFILNQREYFFLKCGNLPIEEVAMPYRLDIIWSSSNKKTIIGQSYSFDATEYLTDLLSDALDNKLFFDEQVYINVGLIWNIFDTPEQAKPILLQYAAEQGLQGELLGHNYPPYILFSAHDRTKKHKTTFLYNNELGEIVLFVSPNFSWPDNPEDSDEFDTSKPTLAKYLSFLKNHKPFLKRVIPREIAQQWLLQAKYLNELFRKNEFESCIHCNSGIPVDFEKYPNGRYHEREVQE